MSDPNAFPAGATHEALPSSERMKSIRAMVKVIFDARGRDVDDRLLGPGLAADWTARGRGYRCSLITPTREPFTRLQLRFTNIRNLVENTYAFGSSDDVIVASVTAAGLTKTDSLDRPHIDRLEELINSGSVPGAYDPTEFQDEDEAADARIDNPMISPQDR